MKSSLPGLKTNDGLLKQGIQPDFLPFYKTETTLHWSFLKASGYFTVAEPSFPDPVRFSKMAAKLFQKAASNETFLLLNSQFSAPCMGLEKCLIPVISLWLPSCDFTNLWIPPAPIIPLSQMEASTSPPPDKPRAFGFLENFCSNLPFPDRKAVH